MGGIVAKKYQVIIVGGGPVGVGLAVDLGLRGVSCLVLERHLESQRIPKGQSLGQRTLEHFYFWGIEDELRAARVMPDGYPIGGITAWGNLLSDYWYGAADRVQQRKFFYCDNERLPQYQTEAVLRKKMATLSNIDSRMGLTAEKIEQDANGVRVTAAKRDGTDRQVFEADYVIGCDGAHSMVREQVGIARGGVNHDQVMVLAVFRSKELHEKLKRFPERSTYRAMNSDSDGYYQFFGRVDVGEGWFFHAPVPANTTKDNYDFHGLLEKVAGFKFAVDFDYVGFWDMRISVAETYQVGRVLIAGDAAHSHPPYGGYGLNSGLEDARNLGWKLAAVVQGWGGPELLHSYSDERRLIFTEIGRDFIGRQIATERDFQARYSPEKDKAEFEAAWEKMSKRGDERASIYEPNYEGSPVLYGPADGISSAHGKHMVKARPGHHLTPRTLSSGRDVYQDLGPGFSLVAFGTDDASVAAFEQAAQAAKVPLTIIRDSYADGREEYESKLVLVRPDQYVVWTGDKLDGSAADILKKVTGRM
jgi:2-polyprenyl-6-methoxyphenol hydroxylase-like FAD-dependent oxidoreductase